MKGSIKNSPSASVEKSSSGKKLIQARLPFKILSTPVPAATSSSHNEPRKRKLSSEGDLPASKIVCTSEIKENIIDSIVLSDEEPDIQNGIPHSSDSALNPVVKLDKIDDFIKNSKDANGRIILSPKTPKPLKKSIVFSRASGSTKSSSGKSNKLIIKLPMSNKKKRKLSEKLNALRSPDIAVIDDVSDGEKLTKKFKGLLEKPVQDDVKIMEDDVSLSAQICLHVTNMSEDSVLASKSTSNLITVEKSQLHATEDIANDSELFSAMNKAKTSESPVDVRKDNKQDSIESEATKNDLSKPEKPAEDKDEDKKEPSNDDDIISLNDYSEPSHDEDEGIVQEKPEVVPNDSADQADTDDDKKHVNTPVKGLESASKLRQRIITPKQNQKQKEREEKQKQREEERIFRQKEKEEKELLRKKEREEKEEQRRREREEKEEQKRKEKEEKDEQRRKEKEEKEKKRLAELEAKNEERRKKEELKEEERRKKEEDRRKKEQEKEEQENKKRKAAEAFTKFFVQSKNATKELDDDPNSLDSEKFKNSNFMPFRIKGNMKLAPIFRKTLDFESKSKLESFLDNQSEPASRAGLYLSCLKSGKYYPGKDSKTWLLSDDESNSDCLLVDDELEGAGQKIDEVRKSMQKYRAKFLYFHQNQRPPYYGTWRKKSSFVKPRRPFAMDPKLFDYEVDSDDEWEEEEPGESLHGSDDEKESEDEYEVDNEFFVPHGHLSDEELQNEDEIDEDNSPEVQKAKLKLLQQEFAQEMKKKTEKIKPRLIGVVWADECGNKPELCSTVIWVSLNKRAMIFSNPPVMTEPEKNENEIGSPVQEKKMPKRCQLNEEQIKDLVKLVHGNKHKKTFMIREFQAFIMKQAPPEETPVEYTKISIREQIDKIAEWKVIEIEGKKKKRLCWMVAPDVLKQYQLEGLGDNNRWEYIIPPKQTLSETNTSTSEGAPARDENLNKEESQHKVESTPNKKKKKKKTLPVITKFTTIISKTDVNDKNSTIDISKPEKEIEKNVEAPKSVESCNDKISTDDEVSKPVNEIQKVLETAKLVENCSIPAASNGSKTLPAIKKRVPILMSVLRGQAIPQNTKSALISDFLKKKLDESKDPPGSSTATVTPMEVETITID